MAALSIKNLDRICLAIVVVVAVVCSSLAAGAGAKKKKEIQAENDLISVQIKKLNQAEKTLTGLRGLLKTTQDSMASYDRKVPDTSDIGGFYKKLHEMMKKREVLLEKVQPLPPVNGKMVIKNPVRLIGSGGFTNIYNFLMELESMDRAVNIENMVIVKTENTQYCRLEMLASILQKKSL